MGLLNRAQEIIGDKTFKGKVTIIGDLILKKHATLYSPDPSEPSLGTWKTVKYANRTTVPVVDTSTNTAGVWSAAVTMPNVRGGTKKARCLVQIVSAASATYICFEAASGVTLDDVTAGSNSRKYELARDMATSGDYYVMVEINLDASLQFKWVTGVSSSVVKVCSPVAYCS